VQRLGGELRLKKREDVVGVLRGAGLSCKVRVRDTQHLSPGGGGRGE